MNELEERGHDARTYRQEDGMHVIDVNLHDARQLFNTFDPAPFHEKDLDPAAEEYIVGALREIGRERCKLVIHLPQPLTANEPSDTLSIAVHHYFAYRSRQMREQLRQLLSRGFVSLLIGSLFLIICLWVRAMVVAALPSQVAAISTEGLLILGWVAMWRPVEIFLYDWWPILGQQRSYARLAFMPVETRVLVT